MHILWSSSLVALLLCSTSLAQASSPECKGNTLEVQTCMGKKIDEANARLTKYLSTAQVRIEKYFASKPNLMATQAAWARYRDLQCGDVFEFWVHGTYRTIASSECSLRLTQQRTHEVWQAYLTYQDSTPPLLPEPK